MFYNKFCKCGCGKRIEKKEYHKKYGIPDYISGHNISNPSKQIIVKCKECGKEIKSSPNKIRQFCNGSCKNKYSWKQPKYKEKLRKSHLGQIPWNKNTVKKYIKYCKTCNKKIITKRKNQIYCCLRCVGLDMSEKTKNKIRVSALNYLKNTRNIPYPCIGRYETQILDYLENIWDCKIERQYKSNGYFIDGYCPMLNLAIEIDEPQHKKKKKMEKDLKREKNIQENLHCSFLRISIEV